MAISDTNDKSPRSDKFSEDYKQEIFVIWYNNGKPAPKTLKQLIHEPDPLVGKIPSEYTLQNWCRTEFTAKAMGLDEKVAVALTHQLVADKVQMLYHHAQIGQRLVDWGMEYFDTHEISNERIALQAVVEGLKIERQSRGAPTALARIAGLSDQQLLDELQGLVEAEGLVDEIEGSFKDDDNDLSDM